MRKDPLEELGDLACDTMRRMVREMLARKPGGHLVESRIDALELRFRLEGFRGNGHGGPQGRELVQVLDGLLDEAVQQAAAFRPGHAWCHRCETAACEHSRPPTSRHIFIAYGPTGAPRWVDLAQHCLDHKHPQVDRLYDDPPAFLTLVQGEEELYGGLLDAFRRGSYELLGQVNAGFYAVRKRAEEGRGVLALSIQVGASWSRRGTARLGLNVLGRAPSGEDLASLWERHDELPWRRAVRWAQAALESVRPRATRGGRREAREAIEGRIDGILRGLARRLAHDHRSRGRRTAHAEQRHASKQRPTPKAIDDARGADPGSVLLDRHAGTVVVLGDRGRTHFFTLDGQHVSSVRYSKDAIARKVRVERWRPATAEELAAFRGNLPA